MAEGPSEKKRAAVAAMLAGETWPPPVHPLVAALAAPQPPASPDTRAKLAQMLTPQVATDAAPATTAAPSLYELQGPDGAIYEVQAPDEASAVAAFQRFTAGPRAAAPQPSADIEAQRQAAIKRAAQRLEAIENAKARLAQGAQPSPPTYQQAMTALRNADAAGDTEAATRLAQIAREAKAREGQATLMIGDTRISIDAAFKDLSPEEQQRTVEAIAAQLGLGQPAPQEQEPSTMEQLRGNMVGNARAATDGLLMGAGDEYFAGLYAALGRDPQSGGWFNYDRPIGERYSDALGKVRAEEDAFRGAHPYTSAAAEITGGLVAPARAGTGFIKAGASGLGRIGRSGLVGGATAAGYGFGEGEGGAGERGLAAALAAPVGAVGGAVVGGIGEGFGKAVGALRQRGAGADTIPTIEGLKAEAGELYEAARQSGITMPEATLKSTVGNIEAMLKAEGFDRGLHPKVNAVLRRLKSEAGDKSLADLEILRRVAAGAAKSIEPDERRLAAIVLDQVDDAVDGLGGDAKTMAAARDVWGRMRRMETIEGVLEKAALDKDFAQSVRSQFRTLAKNPKRLRGFSPEDVATIRAIASGEGGAGLLSGLGRRLSPDSLTGLAVTGGAGFGGAGLSAALIPAAGYGMKKLGDRMTATAAKQFATRSGMSATQRALADALAGPIAPLAPVVAAPGMLAQALFDPRR